MKIPAISRWLLVVGILALLGVTAWMVDRFTPIDWSKEEEPFRSMAMPLKRVTGTFWMDGGSVSIRVTDSNGRNHEFIFPYDHTSRWTPYTTAYHGVYDMNEFPAKGMKMKDAERTRKLAIHLLENHSAGNDSESNNEYSGSALGYLKQGSRFDPLSVPYKVEWTFKEFLGK